MSAAGDLPPSTPVDRTSGLARAQRQIDFFLALMVLTFGFLCASFVARNSDIWMHLASGRLLAQGNYRFGVDPFAYTTEGVYWTNHAWLFDLIAYGLYQTIGGVGLVLVKAAVVAVLAAFLL